MSNKHQTQLMNQIVECRKAIERASNQIKEQERALNHHRMMLANLEERYKCPHSRAFRGLDTYNRPSMCCPDCKLVMTL